MDYKLLLDTAVMAGEILLESGAETWRVEDTMLRMLRMSGGLLWCARARARRCTNAGPRGHRRDRASGAGGR